MPDGSIPFPQPGTAAARMLALARQPGGCTSAMVQAALDVAADIVCIMGIRLERRQMAVKIKPPKGKIRWFGTQADADRWLAHEARTAQDRHADALARAAARQAEAQAARLARKQAQAAQLNARRNRIVNERTIVRRRSGVTPGVHVPGWPRIGPLQGAATDALPIVVPATIQPQQGRAWTHDTRYQVAPGAPVQGAGWSALPLGQYLPLQRPPVPALLDPDVASTASMSTETATETATDGATA